MPQSQIRARRRKDGARQRFKRFCKDVRLVPGSLLFFADSRDDLRTDSEARANGGKHLFALQPPFPAGDLIGGHAAPPDQKGYQYQPDNRIAKSAADLLVWTMYTPLALLVRVSLPGQCPPEMLWLTEAISQSVFD